MKKSLFWKILVFGKRFVRKISEGSDFSKKKRTEFANILGDKAFLDNLDNVKKFIEKNNHFDPSHNRRFTYSWIFLAQYLKNDKYKRMLDIGHQYRKHVFIEVLKHFCPDKVIDYTNFDVRTEKFPFRDETYDIIQCMEVIEHLPDRNEDYRSDQVFRATGVNHMLSECYRVLKPTGILFITTPNLNAYNNIYKLMNFEHPFYWKPHPREFSVRDIREFLKINKFGILRFKCLNSWDWQGLDHIVIKRLREFIISLGLSDENREDDMFVIAQKNE